MRTKNESEGVGGGAENDSEGSGLVGDDKGGGSFDFRSDMKGERDEVDSQRGDSSH
jgi:hypothetical protein